MIDPRADLPAYVRDQMDNGMAERDPYAFAATTIRTVLEFALDDGISGTMSNREHHTLEHLAYTLTALDPDMEVQGGPR